MHFLFYYNSTPQFFRKWSGGVILLFGTIHAIQHSPANHTCPDSVSPQYFVTLPIVVMPTLITTSSATVTDHMCIYAV